jgi:DNA polymerase I-like protein with 3'-5' exonuclease and polymerase domains
MGDMLAKVLQEISEMIEYEVNINSEAQLGLLIIFEMGIYILNLVGNTCRDRAADIA